MYELQTSKCPFETRYTVGILVRLSSLFKKNKKKHLETKVKPLTPLTIWSNDENPVQIFSCADLKQHKADLVLTTMM